MTPTKSSSSLLFALAIFIIGSLKLVKGLQCYNCAYIEQRGFSVEQDYACRYGGDLGDHYLKECSEDTRIPVPQGLDSSYSNKTLTLGEMRKVLGLPSSQQTEYGCIRVYSTDGQFQGRRTNFTWRTCTINIPLEGGGGCTSKTYGEWGTGSDPLSQFMYLGIAMFDVSEDTMVEGCQCNNEDKCNADGSYEVTTTTTPPPPTTSETPSTIPTTLPTTTTPATTPPTTSETPATTPTTPTYTFTAAPTTTPPPPTGLQCYSCFYTESGGGNQAGDPLCKLGQHIPDSRLLDCNEATQILNPFNNETITLRELKNVLGISPDEQVTYGCTKIHMHGTVSGSTMDSMMRSCYPIVEAGPVCKLQIKSEWDAATDEFSEHVSFVSAHFAKTAAIEGCLCLENGCNNS